MIQRDAYLRLLRDLLSGDPARVRSANRELYSRTVHGRAPVPGDQNREADLVLAEVPRPVLQ